MVNEQNELLIRRRSQNGMLPSMLEVPNDCWNAEKKSLIKDESITNFRKKFTFSFCLMEYPAETKI